MVNHNFPWGGGERKRRGVWRCPTSVVWKCYVCSCPCCKFFDLSCNVFARYVETQVLRHNAITQSLMNFPFEIIVSSLSLQL